MFFGNEVFFIIGIILFEGIEKDVDSLRSKVFCYEVFKVSVWFYW